MIPLFLRLRSARRYAPLMSRTRAIAILLAAGAVLGPVLDGFHTHSGTTYYPRPWILMMAWWVPLLFSSATLGLASVFPIADGAGHSRPSPPSWRSTLLAVAIFIALYFASGFAPLSSPAKLALLGAGAVVLMGAVKPGSRAIGLSIVATVIACGVEITLSRVGAFGYRAPDFAGIPMWLPALYIAACAALGQLGRKLLVRP
jgi:hypothetical protein